VPHISEKYSVASNDSATPNTLGDHGQTIDGSANDVRGHDVRIRR
jgi:hypothetical protein